MMVGVVIPVFNRLLRLRRAIDSVLAQTCGDFTMVVVDDGSTNDLGAERDRVEAAGHRWLTLKRNSGPAVARNAGVAALAEIERVEWLAFLDSDDEWLPEKLERQFALHRSQPQLLISQCREVWMRDGAPAKRPQRLLEPEGRIFAECVARCCISPSAVLMRRDLFEAAGGFDERFPVCEDYQLWLRIAAEHEVGLLPEALAVKHGGADDQLTATVPAFDRWRLMALLGLLSDGEGESEPRREILLRGVQEKARILERGALRQGRDKSAAAYTRIADQAAASDVEGLRAEAEKFAAVLENHPRQAQGTGTSARISSRTA